MPIDRELTIAHGLQYVFIIEDGRVTRSQRGAPQEAVISPTLANVYLHYSYDL